MNQWCPPPSCVDQAQACWDQSQQLEALVTKVLQNIITNDPSILDKPGVTDGSSAPAGIVGEFMQFSHTFSIPTTWNFQQLVTVGTLPPGDWNINAEIYTGGAVVGGIIANVSPLPTGMSNALSMGMGIYVTAAEAAMMQQTALSSPVARGSFTVATPLTFLVQTNWLLGGGVIAPQPGTGTLQVGARRVR